MTSPNLDRQTSVSLQTSVTLPSLETERELREEAVLAAVGDIEAQREFQNDEKSRTDTSDPFLVEWEGENDPGNPLNFSMRKKIGFMAMIAGICFLTPTASAMFSPAIPNVMEEFGVTSAVLGSFSVSMFILGYAIGCAEANSIGTLIALRLFAGIGGSAVLSVGGGVIADSFRKEQMGGATAAFSLGPLLGPVIGPVAGGFVTQALGWRWCFWLLTIFGGVITVMAFFVIPETNPHILLQRRAAKKRMETGDERWHAKTNIKETPRQLLLNSLVRPMKLLIFSPIVLSLAIALGVIFGYVYLLFTTFPQVFGGVYGWSEGIIGLSYLGAGIGFMIGLVIVGTTNDRIVAYLTKKHGIRKPEYRMSVMMIATPLVPIGLFWYGWSAEAKTHWIVPILGTVPIGIGMMGFFLPAFVYTIEAFGFYAASAIASLTFFRSLLGTFLPLAGPPLYDKLGLGWGNSVLGFIAVALIPIPFLLYRYVSCRQAKVRYGEWLRTAHAVKL